MAVRTESGKYLSRASGPSPAMGTKTCWTRIRGPNVDNGHVWVDQINDYSAFHAVAFEPDLVVMSHSNAAQSADLFVADYDVWIFLAWTYNGTDAVFRYLLSGGTAFANAVTFQPTHPGTAWEALVVGKGADPRFLDGEVASLKVWSGAVLSEAALLAERRYRNPQSNLANVWGTYHMKSSALGVDSSGNGRHFTETGSPSFAADPVDILGDDPPADGAVESYGFSPMLAAPRQEMSIW